MHTNLNVGSDRQPYHLINTVGTPGDQWFSDSIAPSIPRVNDIPMVQRSLMGTSRMPSTSRSIMVSPDSFV